MKTSGLEVEIEGKTSSEGIIKPLDYRLLLFRQLDRLLDVRTRPIQNENVTGLSFQWGVSLLEALAYPYLTIEYREKIKAEWKEYETKWAGYAPNIATAQRHAHEMELYNHQIGYLMELMHKRGLLLETPVGENIGTFG